MMTSYLFELFEKRCTCSRLWTIDFCNLEEIPIDKSDEHGLILLWNYILQQVHEQVKLFLNHEWRSIEDVQMSNTRTCLDRIQKDKFFKDLNSRWYVCSLYPDNIFILKWSRPCRAINGKRIPLILVDNYSNQSINLIDHEKGISTEKNYSIDDIYLNYHLDLLLLHRRNVYVSSKGFVLVVHFVNVLSKRKTIPSNVLLDMYDYRDMFSKFSDDRDQSIIIVHIDLKKKFKKSKNKLLLWIILCSMAFFR